MRDQKGMPIEYDEVRHGYHYTAPVNSSPRFRLSKGELVALFIARKALEPLPRHQAGASAGERACKRSRRRARSM